MLVISRFRYDDDLAERAYAELKSCVEQFSRLPGYLSGTVGRALDDPTLWVLMMTWENVGAYRRALTSYEIRMHVVPLMLYALDEPSAYEVIVGEGATVPNEPRSRGDSA